jgi:hypothetical protein
MRTRTRQYQERLDQGESAFFLRGLESVDQKAYLKRYPMLIARQVIPTFESVEQWASVYTWREYTPVGSAKILHNAADDLPSVDVTGAEFSQVIKDCGGSYQYTLKEIKRAAAMNSQLDSMRVETCRTSTEQLLDSLLALGDANHKLNGILSLDSTSITSANRVTLYTLSTKAAGGTAWGTLAAPVATGQEVANDLIGIAAGLVDSTNGIWGQFNIVLPIAQYNYAASTRLNAINDTTALDFALKSGFISSIRPWYQCKTAGGSGATRMACFPSDPMVIGGIVPQEWTPQPPQQHNQAFVVNCLASCGGVVCRYPVAVKYADGL